jgi:hypothetical protein
MPEQSIDAAGIPLDRNPGVTCLWFCKGYEIVRAGAGNDGYLFKLPGSSQVRWYREGRKATRDEIMESINGGLPLLQKMAEEEGEDAVAELQRFVARGMKLIPAA